MRKLQKLVFTLVLVSTIFSCEKENDVIPENPKSETECKLNITPETGTAICINGTRSALPGEIIKFVSTFYSRNDYPEGTIFTWSVQSGNMEVLDEVKYVTDSISKSIATIKFNSGFTGYGVLLVEAKNYNGFGSATLPVKLEID